MLTFEFARLFWVYNNCNFLWVLRFCVWVLVGLLICFGFGYGCSGALVLDLRLSGHFVFVWGWYNMICEVGVLLCGSAWFWVFLGCLICVWCAGRW